MQDDEVRSRFDGRGRVELLPGRASAALRCRIEEIAGALGYRLLAVHNLGIVVGIRLDYERDDASQARRRAELTIARLRAGGPLLPAMEPPAPPPPGPQPPAPSRPEPRQRPRRLPSEPPPPPPVAAPARPRFPPRPACPPPPPLPSAPTS